MALGEQGIVGRRALLAMLAFGPLAMRPASAAPSEPEAFIAALGERTLAVIGANGLTPQQRFEGMAGLLEDAADLELIARLVLGRHWRSASEAQRREYIAIFHDYARDSLARRFSGYTGSERFSVVGSRKVGDGDTLVSTQISLTNGTPISVDWRVRKVGDRLVIIDVVAEGISLLVTNRAEFDSVASRSGIEGVLEQMRRWLEST
jgi:phospholipid transport system substrate-binding protein